MKRRGREKHSIILKREIQRIEVRKKKTTVRLYSSFGNRGQKISSPRMPSQRGKGEWGIHTDRREREEVRGTGEIPKHEGRFLYWKMVGGTGHREYKMEEVAAFAQDSAKRCGVC